MEILIKKLIDRYGIESYVFCEQGKFSKPLFILDEANTINLLERLKETIDLTLHEEQ